MNDQTHRSVLLDEAIAALSIRADGIYVDGTFGRGGHSAEILQRLGERGRLLAFDKDPAAIAAAQQFASDKRFSIVAGSFAGMREEIQQRGWMGKVNGVLLDLGVSSPQLDDAARGFSFRQDGPLDMRMDPEASMSAADWLARVDEDELADVLKEYGEERYARRIARAIVEARQAKPITTTLQLADLIRQASPTHEKRIHPATRSFQAIRIFINRELEDLRLCLDQMLEVLAIGGRLVVISFHSLEDRIVKHYMRDQAKGAELPRGLPVMQSQIRQPMRLVGKAVYANEAEVAANPRARSAVMRVAERVS
ncbi:MAG: 16S rRNA (cytosine(1402)-N(4))-methyltransferase RsmH [Pseudomonadota bacterium]